MRHKDLRASTTIGQPGREPGTQIVPGSAVEDLKAHDYELVSPEPVDEEEAVAQG